MPGVIETSWVCLEMFVNKHFARSRYLRKSVVGDPRVFTEIRCTRIAQFLLVLKEGYLLN